MSIVFGIVFVESALHSFSVFFDVVVFNSLIFQGIIRAGDTIYTKQFISLAAIP